MSPKPAVNPAAGPHAITAFEHRGIIGALTMGEGNSCYVEIRKDGKLIRSAPGPFSFAGTQAAWNAAVDEHLGGAQK